MSIIATVIFACSSGDGNSGVNNSVNGLSQLEQYKVMLNFGPLVQKRFLATTNNQQSFRISESVTFTSIDVKFFSNNTCSRDGLVTSITMNGGAGGTVFNAGTYSSTSMSNYALCGRYQNDTTDSSGCSGMFTDFGNGALQSLRFEYNYAAVSGGPGVVAGDCMSGSGDSLYKEAILNWSNGISPWAACTNGAACGFSQLYLVILPTAYHTPQIQSGYFQGSGLDSAGRAWWWGWVVGGTTPVPCTDCGGAYLIPTRVISNLNFSLLSGQYANDCGLVNLSGSAYCWGNGKYGALGNNSTANSTIPVAVSGGNTYSQISTGYRSSCAIDLNSNLWCWGHNAQGQLGTGNFTSSSIPVASASGNFKSVSAGYNFTCALKSDNSAWCFGDNEAGQLGNGSALPCANSSDCSSSYVSTPVAVVGEHSFVAIATAADGYVNDPNSPVGHACAIDDNQDMYCWGSNTLGQLGGGSVSSCTSANPSSCTATPQKVIGGHKFISLTAGAGYSCGIDTAHHAWCWGQNQNGQLGVGNLTSPILTPTAVSGNLEFTQLSGSFTANTCGMDVNGKSWCWGSNICGQLGFTSNMTINYCAGGTAPSEFPYQVSIPTLVNESGYF